jgi:hypothetical protein
VSGFREPVELHGRRLGLPGTRPTIKA